MGIHVLPPDVAAKIAAGEVVERPSSVVKEIVENAIDAGATVIKVETQQGGKRLIQVMDNGHGIIADDVPLAFARHATSKLDTVDDLNKITTLGFRGEALASISAVSRLTLTSRPATQEAAARIRIEGGRQIALGAAGSPAGTIITVENLFYNVPARLKFLKADASESSHIQHVVAHYALAYPHIRFTLQTETRTVFQTNGNGELLDVINSVFSANTAREMIAVENEAARVGRNMSAIAVYGYTGSPSLHRGMRDQIIFFVNKRWIQNRSINQAVVKAYHTFLPVQRYPISILNIELDPAEIDINVHPTKAEIKFRESSAVFKAVQKAVREAVIAASPVPTYGTHPTPGGGHAGDNHWQFDRPTNPAFNQLGFEAQRTLPMNGEGDSPAVTENNISMLRVIGQIQLMYIVAEGADGLYLIDQHAAHERVLYEKLMAQKAEAAVVTQQLLEAAVVELSPAQAAVLEAELDSLAGVGFDIEPFGGTTYRIRAVPEMLGQAEPAQALVDVLLEMSDGAVPLARETHEKVAIIVCKKASIKGGQVLSQEEMRALIRQLEASNAPRTCPHGRPTMIHLSAAQLSREFCRT